ncbi:MAG: FAD-binding oxidoreductase [Actinomycetota bacterium]
MTSCDVVVIGGGIAGVSAAAHLIAAGANTVLVEAEPTLAYHTTGRSAAQYLENYGNDTVRRLTLATRAAIEPFLGPRPLLNAGRAGRVDQLRAEVEHAKELVPTTEFVDGDQARELLPILAPDIEGALYEPHSQDIDVAGFHQEYVRALRAAGGTIQVSAPVRSLTADRGRWTVEASDSAIDARIVVNAAGAWGDRLGALAGATPLGLHPLRRTIAIAAIPEHYDPDEVHRWPLTSFEPDDGPMVGYCKPEPGGLMVSPADETPSEPCDARPEEIDVARGLHNLADYTTLDARHVRSTWAGLRTFAADRTPVSGFDPEVDGFYWLVGQGGYGIHNADAMAQATAANVTGAAWPSTLADVGLSPADLAADRPTLAGPLTSGH